MNNRCIRVGSSTKTLMSILLCHLVIDICTKLVITVKQNIFAFVVEAD